MNLIPRFVLDNYSEGRLSGTFKCVSLSVDLVGFTKMTDNLAKYGKVSVEELSNIINKVFGKSIDVIYKNYGWISSFTGDGFIAIFPLEKCMNAVQSAKAISESVNNLVIKYKNDEFKIYIRAGLSSGMVNWRVIKTTHGNYYYFDGEVLKKSIISQKLSRPGDVILDKTTFAVCKDSIKVEKIGSRRKLTGIIEKPQEISNRRTKTYKKALIREFLPAPIERAGNIGEFRFITSVFLYFKRPKKRENIEQFVVRTVELVNRYNGFLNKIDFADKGNIMLILFGAPIALEKPALNAIEFVDMMREQFGDNIKAGITEGIAYTGIVGARERAEYTAIGEIVNLSSRIGEKIKWGSINVSEQVYKDTRNRFQYKYLGAKKYKGIERGIRVYSVLERKSLTEKLYPGEIIGRKKEITDIIKIINESKNLGKSKIIYIEGPAGIGKSRLTMEVKKRIPEEEFKWLYLPCDGILRESLNPLYYFVKRYFHYNEKVSSKVNKEQFDQVFNKLVRKVKDKNIVEELKSFYPFLSNFIGIETEIDIYANMNAKDIYKNTIHSLISLIKAIASLNAVILEFEDIQWIDDDTINFINLLVTNIKNTPITLLLIGRPSDENKYEKINKERVDIKAIEIEALSKKDCKELVSSVLGAPVSEEIADKIWEKGEGNPFYIEQIAMFLVEKGIIDIRDGRYVLKEKSFEVPESINNVILSRIDKLETKLKRIVKTASVLGRQFPVQVLNLMLNNKVEFWELKRIENKEIWKIINEMQGIFKHGLIRDAVYNMQLKRTLRKLHKIAAKAIEEVFAEDIENHVSELAYHYYEAEEYKKAKKYMLIAAQKAKEQYRNSDALDIYEKLLSIENNRKNIVKLKLEIIKIFQLMGKWKPAIELINKTIKDAEKIKDNRILGLSYQILAIIYESTERIDESEKYVKKALAIFKKLNDKKLYSRAIGVLGTVYYHRAQYKQAIEIFNEKLALDKKIGYKIGYYDALSRLGLIYFDYGKLDMALKMFKENLEFAKKVGDISKGSHMLGDMGLIYWKENKHAKALKNFKEVLKIARKIGDKQSEASAANNIGIMYLETGDYKNAIKYLNYAYKLCEEMGDKVTLGSATGNLGLVYVELGDLDKAIRNFNITKEIADATNDPLSKAIAYLTIAETYVMKREYGKAKDSLEKGIELFSKIKMDYMLSKAYYLYAKIWQKLGDNKKSAYMLEKSEESLKIAPRDDTKFLCSIIRNELLRDKQKAVKNLIELAKKRKDKADKAEAYYSAFSISRDKKIARKTLDLYEKLYNSLHKFIFKQRIDELKEFLNR